MRRSAALLLTGVLAGEVCAQEQPKSFQQEQLTHTRVQAAAKEKDPAWRALFAQKHLQFPPRRLLLLAFKREAVLEVWASDGDSQKYVLLKSFPICASSGQEGPKRRVGDGQVPEGFYEIERFNPLSNFYLSLRVSYPNSSDRILGSHENLGGDILVHGNCVTIGCLPITDDGIKEVYWLSVLARQSGQKLIPIWIFPCRFSEGGFRALVEKHRQEPELVAFWGNLKEGFDLFEEEHRVRAISVASDGRYHFGALTSQPTRYPYCASAELARVNWTTGAE
jgi:murein L,D-transpeptidase YafK